MHVSVLQNELLHYLNPKPNQNFIDCTADGGGDVIAILEKNKPKGKVLAIEWSPTVLEQLRKKVQDNDLSNRVILVNDSYVHLKEIVQREQFKSVSGILLDLGLSSWHLQHLDRGFTFQKNQPLDMRYNPSTSLTAQQIINEWSEEKLGEILLGYGEESFGQKIASEIVKVRRKKVIETTFELVRIIREVVPSWYQKGKTHEATKTFQALRIAVNGELDSLTQVLPQAIDVLEPQGKLAVVSFHRLEDRIVKTFFRQIVTQDTCTLVTKKPITPSSEEIKRNPRSRSAKLRVVQKN
jgi:16S rRNA (cytosine1402-N4)-methyltransferase